MGNNPVNREDLDGEILAFIEKGIEHPDEQKFNQLALKEFVYQYHENDVYQTLCQSKGIELGKIVDWRDIPAIPTEAFKQSIIASFPLSETELSLLTSGTTNPDARGKIYRDKTSLELIKKCNYMLTKEFLFPDTERMRMCLLVPSPKVAPGMPMAYGLELAKNAFGTEQSAYYISPRGLAADDLINTLTEVIAANEPVCLMGATSGFVYFFNICQEKGLKFTLPSGSRVCDGGGYQGTFGECSREQYYALVQDYLAIPQHMCVNTLGMGESGTNYFDNVLRDYSQGIKDTERHKVDLPWTRTIVVGIRTGQRLPKGEIGLIRHIDLTNIATVLAVQTDNLGYETERGFEILGRSENVPGYDVRTPGGLTKDWLLGVGQYKPQPDYQVQVAGTVNQCSTVADGMMKQGHPCSTVADGMMKQGNPCSTVADGMIKQGNPCSTVVDDMHNR
ncbi:MAG: hypothetical protein WA118_03045 [Carboxydocellales bacterium]